MKVLGIDPGKKGAMVFLEYNNTDGIIKHVSTHTLPIIGKGKGSTLDIRLTAQIIDFEEPDLIVMEKVHAMPKQGTVSMFSFGKIYGELVAIVSLEYKDFIPVSSPRWKKVILEDYPKGDKESSIKYCKNRFPRVSLLRTERSRIDDNNIADALCLAMYGIKENQLINRKVTK